MTLPHAESAYLAAVVDRLRELLGDDLVGVYPTGSVALGGYRPGRSDLDVIAVAERPSPAQVGEVAAALSHDALPCPAAGLEFVLYDRATLAGLTTLDGFALNLNTGRELTSLVEPGPAGRPGFWYPIDRDIIAQQDRVLAGPLFSVLAPRLPGSRLRPVVVASVAANLGPDVPLRDDAVLNACRALRWYAEGSWTAKPDAARWALPRHPAFAPLLTSALATYARDRAAGREIDTAAARSFLAYVLSRLDG